jgi:prophage regulatory protein
MGVGAEMPAGLLECARLASSDEFWGLKIVQEKTGLSRSTIYSYVAIRCFPRQRQLGPRCIPWLASEVAAWIATRPKP